VYGKKMKLKTYLAETEQTQEQLAKKLGVCTLTVGRMIKRGAIVIDNKIYSPQYEIKDD
tara:strand:- start:591 stop:767 length:177 start_codon:yes stop_codon:yes gene_type:complete